MASSVAATSSATTPVRRKGSEKHREQVVKELEQELESHPDRQATARWAIDLLASGRYKRYLTIDKQGRIRLDREAVRQASKYDGKWVLQTNDDTISVEDAAAGYKGLLVIERASGRSRAPGSRWSRCITGCPNASKLT